MIEGERKKFRMGVTYLHRSIGSAKLSRRLAEELGLAAAEEEVSRALVLLREAKDRFQEERSKRGWVASPDERLEQVKIKDAKELKKP
jgi:hypothetical protein